MEHPFCVKSSAFPTEVLHDIFCHLRNNEFDLIACSLVCTDWYYAARPLVPNYLIQRFGGRQIFLATSELVRASTLLTESSHYSNVDYCNLITKLHFEFRRLDYDTAGAYKNILHALPKLGELCLDMRHYEVSQGAHKINSFLDSIIPLCKSIKGLHIIYSTFSKLCSTPNPEHLYKGLVNCIPPIVKALAPNIISLQTEYVPFGKSFQDALSLCINMREVNLVVMDFAELVSVIPCWPHLRKIKLHCHHNTPVNPLVIAFATSCPDLTEVDIKAGAPYCKPWEGLDKELSSEAACRMLERCPNIKILALQSRLLDDSFLRALARSHPRLEKLVIDCPEINGELLSADEPVETWWPGLQVLHVHPGSNLSWSFAEKLLGGCKNLGFVTLPALLEEHAIESFKRLGFEGFKRGWTHTAHGYWRQISDEEDFDF